MKFLTSLGSGRDAIDGLYEQVKIELSQGNDIHLELVPFWNGIGQMVASGNPFYEYQLIAEKDIRAFNGKLGDYVAEGWFPHMGVTPWQGFFIQWVGRQRGSAVIVEKAPKRGRVPHVVEDAPSLSMVERAERLYVFPFGSVPSILLSPE